MKFFVSEIESKRFGVRCGRCDEFTSADWPALSAAIASERCQLVTIRCAAKEIAAAQTIIAHGGSLMDTVVTMESAPLRAVTDEELAKHQLREGGPADEAHVARLTRAAFGDYINHYRADPRLDGETVTQAMIEWSVSFTRPQPGRKLILAGPPDDPVGYAAMAAVDGVADGVLHGVTPTARGRGIYKGLLLAGMRWGQEQGCTRMTVVTQLHNTHTQRGMAALGMRPAEARYTFHLWTEA